MTKTELEEKKKKLNKELSEISKQLADFDFEEKKAKYGKEFNCNYCKYNAVNDFSCDGWHNTCGAGNCTCCHSVCEEYEPDNEVTLYIKKNIRADYRIMKNGNWCGHISDEEYNAVETLAGDIFKPNGKEEKIINVLRASFETKQAVVDLRKEKE